MRVYDGADEDSAWSGLEALGNGSFRVKSPAVWVSERLPVVVGQSGEIRLQVGDVLMGEVELSPGMMYVPAQPTVQHPGLDADERGGVKGTTATGIGAVARCATARRENAFAGTGIAGQLLDRRTTRSGRIAAFIVVIERIFPVRRFRPGAWSSL